MFARTLVLSLIAALATSVLAHETNADRFARGLTPLRPRRLFTSGHHVARTLPSGVACSNDALEGYIALRYTNGDGLLGYFNDDTSSCSSDSSKAAKFEYPDGCDTKTFIKRFGVNLYIGAVARSVNVVKSVVSDVSKLIFGRSESSSDDFCFTGSKMVSELFTTKTEVDSSFVETSAFKIASSTHKITQCWEEDEEEHDLSPIACFGANGAVSVQWVKDPSSVTASIMASVCPSGINVEVYLRFECALI
ncbi:hypothetical protein BDZ89DRAFT_1167455 [Hymenopellis radicata]|nr:hypothetical protein BDZ89DRAFT_1167455 [Hymenopellis radicata]